MREISTELENIEKGRTFNTNKVLIQAWVILQWLSDRILRQHGLSAENISLLRFYSDITTMPLIPRELFYKIAKLSANFEALLDLRIEAAEAARKQKMLQLFPQYNLDSIQVGVTRSKTRISIYPTPVRFKGHIILPMHGLGVYDSKGNYVGNLPYSQKDFYNLDPNFRKNTSKTFALTT